MASALVALAALTIAAGCGGGNATPDAGDASAVDAPHIGDAHDAPDVATLVDAGAGADVSDAAATSDAVPADFVAIAPCPEPGAYATGIGAIGTLGNTYSPACLRVQVGSRVSIEASVTHPLEPRAGGSAGNPIPSQISNADVVFTAPGFYPFLCPEHVDQGMLGVIWVAP